MAERSKYRSIGLYRSQWNQCVKFLLSSLTASDCCQGEDTSSKAESPRSLQRGQTSLAALNKNCSPGHASGCKQTWAWWLIQGAKWDYRLHNNHCCCCLEWALIGNNHLVGLVYYIRVHCITSATLYMACVQHVAIALLTLNHIFREAEWSRGIWALICLLNHLTHFPNIPKIAPPPPILSSTSLPHPVFSCIRIKSLIWLP